MKMYEPLVNSSDQADIGVMSSTSTIEKQSNEKIMIDKHQRTFNEPEIFIPSFHTNIKDDQITTRIMNCLDSLEELSDELLQRKNHHERIDGIMHIPAIENIDDKSLSNKYRMSTSSNNNIYRFDPTPVPMRTVHGASDELLFSTETTCNDNLWSPTRPRTSMTSLIYDSMEFVVDGTDCDYLARDSFPGFFKRQETECGLGMKPNNILRTERQVPLPISAVEESYDRPPIRKSESSNSGRSSVMMVPPSPPASADSLSNNMCCSYYVHPLSRDYTPTNEVGYNNCNSSIKPGTIASHYSQLDDQMKANMLRIHDQHLNAMKEMDWRNRKESAAGASRDKNYSEENSLSDHDSNRRGKPTTVELRRYKESESQKYRDFKNKQRLQQEFRRKRDRQVRMKVNIAMSENLRTSSSDSIDDGVSSLFNKVSRRGLNEVVEIDECQEESDWRRMQQRAITKKNLEIAELYRRKESAFECQFLSHKEEKGPSQPPTAVSSTITGYARSDYISDVNDPNWWLKNPRYSGSFHKGFSNGPYRNSWIADWRVRGRDFLPREADDGSNEEGIVDHSIPPTSCIERGQNIMISDMNLLLAAGRLLY